MGSGFTVVAVALDSREDAARPFIEAASPSFPCLIDRDHLVADLYHMVNVPQAVWIDEDGTIVRPTETAGTHEGFRQMDRQTFQMPEEALAATARARETYLGALRDWVDKGSSSEFAFGPEDARAHVEAPGRDVALAHASFRRGQHLLRSGKDEEGRAFVADAVRLQPESWSFWRQNAEPSVAGLAAGPEFWERVDALGERRYYAAVDMKGMPD